MCGHTVLPPHRSEPTDYFMTSRAVLYARYSSEQQSAASVEDQFRVSRSRVQREGWTIVAEHFDDAVSGSTPLANRRGGKGLLADLMAMRFDVLVLEGLDRLSRDQVEQESVIRRMEHRGVRILGIADGYDSQHAGRKIMRGVRGLLNEIYIDDLRHKTHRGQTGRVLGGYVAGGKSFGFSLVQELRNDVHVGSRYVVDETEAPWVRRIFADYAAGKSAQSIAHELNALAAPTPRGNPWSTSAIYGSPNKGAGILNNILYIGRQIWNRSQWLKDPDTGARVRTERPRTEWLERDAPELRIVDQATWDAVRDRMDRGRGEDGRKMSRPARTLFGGLMRCPHCTGSLVATDATYYGCAQRKDRGPTVCEGFTIRRTIVDRVLTGVVREDLLSPAAAEAFARALSDEIERQADENGEMSLAQTKQRRELKTEVSRIVDAIAAIGHSDALITKLKAAEAALLKLQVLKPASRNALSDIDAQKIFAAKLLRLGEELGKDAGAARNAIEEIVGKIILEQRDEEVWAHLATDRVLQLGVAGSDIAIQRRWLRGQDLNL
jgi:site-specific DNA recombinase